ncbi:class I SAM-dependent methyltransferase [Sphingomonas daechungensis]|uniref:class I SAM-dependent methyltransferase n=1 Tax=Sphingomonas daechungensis TaxID=1176646 RepID=UPI0037841A0D
MSGASEDVARQYSAYSYPKPIDNLAAAIEAGGVDSSDPRHFHLRYWPDRPYRPEMRILVAGCGTNQAAHLAFTNRQANVIGIDLSAPSLEHQARLKKKHGLTNLRLKQLDLRRVADLGEEFDLIVSTGVLHHLPDPVEGLRALAAVLDRDGAIHVMLYGRYARVGVYMMQELFRRIGVGQSAQDIAFVRQVLSALPADHYLNWHRRRSGDLEHDAGIVDTLLHPVDRAFSSDEVIELAAQAGLVFQCWGENRLYYPDARIPPDNPLAARLLQLPDREQWACVDLFVQDTMLHSAVYCRPERDPRTYLVDWSGSRAPGFVPVWNVGTSSVVDQSDPSRLIISRADDSLALSPEITPLFAAVDGHRSISECAEKWDFTTSSEQRLAVACAMFRTLWRRSLLQVRIPAIE